MASGWMGSLAHSIHALSHAERTNSFADSFNSCFHSFVVCFSFIFHYEGTANFPNRQENLEKFFSFYKDFSKTLIKSTPE